MKKLIITIFCAFIAVNLFAVRAIPDRVRVIQPDGTEIAILVHGDEYLNYTTTLSGRLIAPKADGYYYYASFKGAKIEPSSQRISSSDFSGMFTKSEFTIPFEAIQKANEKRALNAQMMAENPGYVMRNTKTVTETPSFVLLVQFPERKFSSNTARADFNNMLNQNGYSYNGATGSAKEYYLDNSMGTYNFKYVVGPIVTVSKSAAYYYDNGKMDEMVVEACLEAEKLGVDFSQFDTNKDNVVDNIYMFFAGYDKAEGGVNTIWSHAGSVNSSEMFGEKRLGRYSCSSELKGVSGSNISGIGTFCHEFGHVLGLKDLYDTDYKQNGQSPGLYNLALMSGGNDNNNGNTPPYLTVIERMTLGLIDPDVIKDAGNYTLQSIDKNKAYIIESGNPNEYICIEARSRNKWDEPIDENGLLIYHIDNSDNDIISGIKASSLFGLNKINAYLHHECAKVLMPNPNAAVDYTNDLFYPGTLNVSSRSFKSWNDRQIPQVISDINASGELVSFKVSVPDYSDIRGKVFDRAKKAIAGAKIFLLPESQLQAMTKSNANGLRQQFNADMITKSSSAISVVSDSKGAFSVKGVAKGNYAYTVMHDSYVNSIGVLEITLGDNVFDFKMLTFVEKNSSTVSWSNMNVGTSLGGIEGTLWVSNMWKIGDLKEHYGKKITQIVFNLTNNINNVTVGINYDDVEVYSKNIGANYSHGINEIDISAQGLVVPNNKSVRVWVKVSDLTNTDFLLALDTGPAKAGKGDLYSGDGKNWMSASGVADANFIVGFSALTDEGQAKIKTKVLQRDVFFDLTKLNTESKSVKITYTKFGDKDSKTVDCGNVKQFIISGLEPDFAYTYTIDVNGVSISGGFTTDKLTSEYALIYETAEKYKADDELILALLNLDNGIKSVKWFVNNVEYKQPTIKLTTDVTIRAEITHAQGDVETITRKIKLAK